MKPPQATVCIRRPIQRRRGLDGHVTAVIRAHSTPRPLYPRRVATKGPQFQLHRALVVVGAGGMACKKKSVVPPHVRVHAYVVLSR